MASNFLEVWDDDFSAAHCPTSAGTRAAHNIEAIVTGQGQKTGADKGGTDRTLRNICWQCLGQLKHDDPYKYLENNEETGESQVMSFFSNERNRNMAPLFSKATINGLFKSAIRNHPKYRIALQEAHAIALNNPILPVAADCIVEIAPHIVIQYKCIRCCECPTLARMWVRTANYWYCPNSECWGLENKQCCEKLTWGGGATGRVMFLPNDFEGREMTSVILGQCDDEDEACITLIKTAGLIKMFRDKWGKECRVTWKHLVACIRQIDDNSHNVIMTRMKKYRRQRAVENMHFRTCEHPSLSLTNWGEMYLSTHVPNDTQVLNIRDRKEVLLAICLHFGFTEVKQPSTNGVTRRVWENLTSQEHIDRAEEWMTTGFQQYIAANATLNEIQFVPPPPGPPPDYPPAADQW